MRIGVASLYGEGAHFAWLFNHEGHEATLAVADEGYANVYEGLVPKVDDIEPSNFDLVVFDSSGSGALADEIRQDIPLIGGSALADKLEDRLFGLDFMTRCGLLVAPYEAFDNPADGIRHIKKRNKRMVFKPIGEQDDKSTTYVAKSPEDMLRYFDVLFRDAKVSQYILQDFIEGVEASSEVYINQNGYYALNHTIETKKLMNGELGPNTGCSGSLCWMTKKENLLFQRGIGKCIEPLQQMDFVGPIDLNSIINAEGCWALEFTPRFGYDATALLTRLLPVGFGDFLYAVAVGDRVPDLTAKHSFCSSVRLSIPPYPCEGLPEKAYKTGVPIEGLRERNLDKFYLYDARRRGESDDLETAGLCGWIGSPLAVGEHPGQAFEGAYDMLKDVRVPNGQYRTDVCEATTRRYLQLRDAGYLK